MNRTYFIARVKAALFGGRISATQIAGLMKLLAYRDAHYPSMSNQQLAYVLATVKHETAHTMQPVKEYGGNAYYKRMYDIEGERPNVARKLGNTKPGDGVRYCGRGYVQITGRSNYRTFGIENTPEKALEPETAARIAFDGMVNGKFTGRALRHYIGAVAFDYVGAREIINSRDKAQLIAGYAQAFATALKQAQEQPDSPAPVAAPAPVEAPQGQTVAPVTVDPIPPPVEGPPEEQATGKPMLKSSTNIAATVGAIAGVATPATQAVTQITETINTGKTFSDAVVSAGPWLLLVLVIAGVAGWIIYQRYLKSKNEGV